MDKHLEHCDLSASLIVTYLGTYVGTKLNDKETRGLLKRIEKPCNELEESLSHADQKLVAKCQPLIEELNKERDELSKHRDTKRLAEIAARLESAITDHLSENAM
ncbi:MAG: hypothetical protein MRY21_02540 [Simkaniaceae bacterium]|nr:hypothetical protein [Simkaniaceae bacterium]